MISLKSGGFLISSLEYPGKISFVIFTAGCSLRCPYCHNPELITGGKEVNPKKITDDIRASLDFIDALVITGGEPLLQGDDLYNIIKFAQKNKLKIKLDTNGCLPHELSNVINQVDYVALDIKAPFNKYREIIGSDIGLKVKKSMNICLNTPDTFLECRTTYVPGLLDERDLIDICKSIDCDLYTLQQFRNRVVLDEKLKNIPNPTREELFSLAEKIKSYMKRVKIRTAEFGDEFI